MSNLISPDHDFMAVVQLIESARQRVSRAVNTELIDLYWAVGEYVLKQESAKVRAALTNRHSLFFIPMQYLAFVMGGIGIMVMVVGAFRL